MKSPEFSCIMSHDHMRHVSDAMEGLEGVYGNILRVFLEGTMCYGYIIIIFWAFSYAHGAYLRLLG